MIRATAQVRDPQGTAALHAGWATCQTATGTRSEVPGAAPRERNVGRVGRTARCVSTTARHSRPACEAASSGHSVESFVAVPDVDFLLFARERLNAATASGLRAPRQGGHGTAGLAAIEGLRLGGGHRDILLSGRAGLPVHDSNIVTYVSVSRDSPAGHLWVRSLPNLHQNRQQGAVSRCGFRWNGGWVDSRGWNADSTGSFPRPHVSPRNLTHLSRSRPRRRFWVVGRTCCESDNKWPGAPARTRVRQRQHVVRILVESTLNTRGTP